MTKFTSQISHYQRMQLEQVQHLNAMVEARKGRVASIAFRKEMHDKARVKNYQTEYDRIRAHVEQNSATPHRIKEHVKNRAAELRALGARAVDNIV